MLRGMTSQQFVEWQVFGELEPFAPERDDYRTGVIVRMLANAHRNSKRHPTPYNLEECTPKFGDLGSVKKVRAVQSWQQMKALAIAMTESSKRPERIIGRRLQSG